MLRGKTVSNVRLDSISPERKKAIMTLILIQGITVLHEILHLSWFTTNHYFALVGILISFQFVNFYAFVSITTMQPGIIQKIVLICFIRELKIRDEYGIFANTEKRAH